MSDANSYGQTWAPIYDETFAAKDPTETVAVLSELAGSGRALELGSGTGRIAIPLAATGITVHAIEASEAMVSRMRAKVGGDAVKVTQGDFTQVAVEGEFAVIFVVFSTLFALPNQGAQVTCFRNVAQRLAPGGVFVVEAFVPDPTRFDGHQRVQVNRIEPQRVELAVSRHDPVEQRVTGQHVVLGDQGVKLYPVEVRYAWPTELDLMAQLAGLRLRERWSDWQRRPFTATSPTHVSIYERA